MCRKKSQFCGQCPCSNLGRVFELSPLVKVVISWQVLMKLLALIRTSSTLQPWETVYLIITVLRLPVWQSETIIMLQSMNSEDSWRLWCENSENNNFLSLNSDLEGKKNIFLSLSANQTGQADCQSDWQVANFLDNNNQLGAGWAEPQPVKCQFLEFFTCQFGFHCASF